MTPSRMPAAFIGHGSPMNTLESNRYTQAWRRFGQAVPRPRAILVVSAHWFIGGSALTAMANPRVIHDFYGFPQALFDFDYPAPGAPDIAEEIAAAVRPGAVALDRDSWGLDHGTWSVLAHMFPQADVPVLQLSIHAGEDIAYHVDLGRQLAPLRERGILIVGSGNVVHNLRLVERSMPDTAFDWAADFDAQARQLMTASPGALARLASHPAYRLAVPTPEHFLPLAYLAGLASAAGEGAQVLVEGGVMGALTMTSFVLGCDPAMAGTGGGAAAPIPGGIAPQDTNT
ncbi:4,5-DOPA-extradiol-dioxygenase [Massilia sp. GCM10023247]|uniref:4,5-DOPA-extradiol-dioxygenase n=1 Tax=Massilia sp. GCM10023247 TaxID=3252643 RepID=UPI00360ED324